MKALLDKIRKILRDRRTRILLTRLVSGVAAVVVFITTYALVLPAITMESQAACGIEAHQHDDSCYTEELICGQEESEGHHHTEDCYTVTKDLVCSLEEHQHSAENGCYDEDGNLICKLEEHTHTDSCYEEHRELTCGLEETDGHTHTDSCYKKVLTCGKPVHTHSAACYKADPELQSAAVASTGMTSAAAMSDYSEEEYAREESHDGSIGSQAFNEPEEIGTEDQDSSEEVIDEDSSSTETEDDQDADIQDENADKEISDEGISEAENNNDPASDLENGNANDSTAESDDVSLNSNNASEDIKDENADTLEKGDTVFEESAYEEKLNTENDEIADKEGEETASSFSTGFAAEEYEDSYVPEKEALDFNTVLNNRTGIYYHHLTADETVEDSSAITDWTRADEDTELNPQDIVRVYLSYTLPKDTINATNDISRYRLPDALHLTDDQIEAINSCENGISAQYIDYDSLEITDSERHTTYLGLESVEGTRRPGEELKEDSQEYISAVVRAEKIYDEDTGKYEGTDLIFTFSPYAVEKNAHEYDKKGQPTRAGEEVTGWLTLDFNMGQIDWDEDNTSEIVFAEEDKISTVLKQADSEEAETDESAADGTTEAAAEYATEEIATAATTVAETAAENSTEAAAADTAATAATASETAAESISEKTDANAKTDSENDKGKNINEETAVAAYPAAVFDDSITVRSGRLDTDLADTNLPKKTRMTVHVEADEGTFPEGTKMVLSTVEDLDAVAEAVGTAVDAKTRGFQAVDISFYDKDPSSEDAKEIEPLKPIKVSIKSDEIKKAAEDSSTAPVVVHIEDDNTATEIENIASKTDSGTIEIEKPAADPENTSDPAIQSDDGQDDGSEKNVDSQESDSPAESSAESKDESADNMSENRESTDKATTGGTIEFEADSFSVYAIVYTVDFEYSVNGKIYQFSLPGGGFVSFTDLIEVLGIIGEENSEENGAVIPENARENSANEDVEENGVNLDTNTALTLGDVVVSEATREFVADVASVEFSNPSLVDVSRVNENTTVGQIKEKRGLECKYSAELTEEQIAEINAQTVEAGDWALISMLPFDTEETLTVTMKDGEIFKIKVTDDQENPFGLDGKSYAITSYKNNHNYYLGSDGNGISTSNSNCLKAIEYNPNDWGTPQGSIWTFEWTHDGKKYLIHDNQNRYILIENDKVSLTDRDTALANPITVVSREGKYSFVNEKNNQALNIYGSSGFGRWDFNEGNSDFLMTLQNPSNLKTPGTIATADTSGLLQINLFDYGPENQLDKEANNNSNPYSGGINSGHTLKFFSYGKNIGNGVNDFTGAGNGPQTGIVADQLSGDYPVLASNQSESLGYLFGGETNSNVTPYTGLNYLFTKDENGYYHYNSDQNYAYLNGSNFEVYSKTFPEEGADEQYFGVGFFPFDPYNEYYNCIHGKDGFEYWDPHKNGTNPKKNGHYNHHFGMSIKGNFIMPPDGQYNGKDVTFQFSGDDDMWVFVDGVLIMDIGGVHNPVHGEINFTTGEVTVHGAAQENFKEKYKRITGNDWDDSDFSNHDFRVFYMERGGMYSNLEVTFNLPLTPETETNNFQFDKVSSENESLMLSDAEFSLFNDPDCSDPFTLASVPVKTTSDNHGVVSFKNIPHGTYYMKETVYPEGYQAKTPAEIFTVVVDASGGRITSSSGNSISKVTNKPKKIDVEVEKIWSNDIVPGGAEIEIILGRYKLVEDPNAPGTATLVIKDSYTGLPSGSSYHVTYTITGPDGYSQTITKAYTNSSKQIEESVEVPAAVAGSQYTVIKQVQNISYHNINNQNQTVNVTVAKNGTGQTQFNQSTFTRNAYRVRIYAVNSTDPNNLYSENYYPANSALTIHIEAGETWTWSNGYRFKCSSSTTSSTKEFSSNGTWNFTSSLKSDIDLVVTCTNNSDWNKTYSWLKEPYITGASPVQTSSTGRMMMSVRRGASALSMSQTASAPTLPDPPQNTLYELDEDYAANPDKITLSGGTWTGKIEDLPAWNELGPYVYYIASVNETGMPEGTQMTISDEVSTDGSAQVLTVTNTVPTGYLRIDKSVTFNGISPVPDDKKSGLAGTYEFKVYIDEYCSIPYKVKNGETESELTLAVTIGSDGAAKSSETVKLPVGDYWIEEQTPSQSGVTPDANRIHVLVTEGSSVSNPATVEFVNNKDESNNPDEQAIELEKKFAGITDASQIPSDFHVTLSYKVPGSDTPVSVTLNSSTAGHVTCTKSNNDLTWHWRITHIPVNATDFSVSENNYDIGGYTRVTKINGTTVDDPSSPEGIVVLQPEITMVNFWSDYTTSDRRKIFPVTGNQILLVRSTSGVTVVVSQNSLSMATRKAIEDLIIDNNGKIPGNPEANASWNTTFVYFSHEIQGNSFSYGGRTIFFNGNNVEVPHNASSHEVRVDINYVSETAQNSFVLENNYTEIPIVVDVEKVKKDDTSVKLPGAVFTLRQIKDEEPTENGTYATMDGTSPRDSEPTAETTGMTSFNNLKTGYYELTEKTSPAGYVLTGESTTYFKVENGVVIWLIKEDGKPSTWTRKSAKASGELIDFEAAVTEDTEHGIAAKNAKFIVENEPGAALPNTGGPGTRMFTIFGTVLLAFAGIVLIRRLRTI